MPLAVALNGVWIDFIEQWLDYTAGTNSPPMFRLWSGISLVAGALERRVWTQTGQRSVFPNLYTMLVAPPGVGKFIIEDVRDLWNIVLKPNTDTFAFRVGPDNMTKAAMIDALAGAQQIVLPQKGPPQTYHSLLVATEEMETFMPEYDREFIGVLNSIYNNKPYYDELRRHGPNRKIRIENPQLNILAGAQPAYMASRFPEDMWSTGFSRRIIMVYCGEGIFQELWDSPQALSGSLTVMARRLGQMSALFGEARWAVDAADGIAEWHRTGCPPVPQHSKLSNYNRSRTVHVIKLATISAIARTGTLVVTLADFIRGRAWLLEAERAMPDIFREMIGKSDQQVIEELHYYVTAVWAKDRQQAVNGEKIMEFLLQRVPTEKAQKVMQAAAAANYIQRAAGTDNHWLPRPKIEARGVQ
jgi:hypothetical protein